MELEGEALLVWVRTTRFELDLRAEVIVWMVCVCLAGSFNYDRSGVIVVVVVIPKKISREGYRKGYP